MRGRTFKRPVSLGIAVEQSQRKTGTEQSERHARPHCPQAEHRHQRLRTHPVTLKRERASSSISSPSPGTSSLSSTKPTRAPGSPLKMYQISSLPTSTSTGGKYSAIGEFKLAITT